MKKLIFTLLAILLWASSAWGTTYYITQSGSGDGSSYAQADSIADFNAAVFGELDDDTVYLCGTITTQVNIPDDGTSGHNIIIRGDYPSAPGKIWALWANGKDYVTLQNIEIPGQLLVDGDNWTINNVKQGNGSDCFNFETTGQYTTANITAGGTILWSYMSGSTSTSANPGKVDFTSAAKRYHSVCASSWSGKSIMAENATYDGTFVCNIGDLPSGLTGSVNLNNATALTGDIGQLPSGLTGSVSLASATALTYTSANWPINTGNSKSLLFDAAIFDQAEIDDILCDCDAKGNTGCTLNISGGTVQPSAAGNTCKTSLQGKGWTVTTN